MKKMIKLEQLSNTEQYLIFKWLDIVIARSKRHEIVLETESLSLK
ncbi:hypothetical protein [Mesoplasma syrphidae]|nr:hypothetical protein [Mesoplasma syrphidae]